MIIITSHRIPSCSAEIRKRTPHLNQETVGKHLKHADVGLETTALQNSEYVMNSNDVFTADHFHHLSTIYLTVSNVFLYMCIIFLFLSSCVDFVWGQLPLRCFSSFQVSAHHPSPFLLVSYIKKFIMNEGLLQFSCFQFNFVPLFFQSSNLHTFHINKRGRSPVPSALSIFFTAVSNLHWHFLSIQSLI